MDSSTLSSVTQRPSAENVWQQPTTDVDVQPIMPALCPRFAPLDEFRETVREDVRKSAKAPLLPVPPVFPAARIPVGDGGPALGGQNEIIRWTDRALPPAGVPDRFAPLFSRREPRSLRYPDWNGWPAALECLLRWNDRRDRFTSPH